MRKPAACLALFFWMVALGCLAQQSQVITYQGQLQSSGQVADGRHDFEFRLWDDPGGGSQIGPMNATTNVAVRAGLFLVDLDFGSTAFDAGARWLEIRVRRNGDPFPYATLTPRQRIAPAPQALYAANAARATIAANLAEGSTSLSNATRALLTSGWDKLTVGNSNKALIVWTNYDGSTRLVASVSNILIGVDSLTGSYGGPSAPGGSIMFPDHNGIQWLSGAALYDWNNHGTYLNTYLNELQLLPGYRMALACYYGSSYTDSETGISSGVQLGGSGPHHETFWLQYDDPLRRQAGLGLSKTLSFVTKSSDGLADHNARASIRARAVHPGSTMAVLDFFSGNTHAADNSPVGSEVRNWLGGTRTNGWNFRGNLIEEALSTTSRSNILLNFDGPVQTSISAGAGPFTFYTTGRDPGTTNYQHRIFLVRGSGSVTLNPSWMTQLTAPFPSSLIPGQVLRLELEGCGPGETNVMLVSAALYRDTSFVWDPDATNYIARAGTTNEAVKIAINALVRDLKSSSLWQKWYVLYPFAGDNAASSAENLLSSSNRITWSGAVYHTNGVCGDGFTGYGDTGFNPAKAGVLQDQFSIYLFNLTPGSSGSASYLGGVTDPTARCAISRNANLWQNQGISDGHSGDMVALYGVGSVMLSRTGPTEKFIASNPTSTGFDNVTPSAGVPNGNVHILARNMVGTGASNHTTNRLGAFGIGAGCTLAEYRVMEVFFANFQSAIGH